MIPKKINNTRTRNHAVYHNLGAFHLSEEEQKEESKLFLWEISFQIVLQKE